VNISSILSTKSSRVYTITPDQTLADAVSVLSEYNIGALIVLDDNDQVVGIISERDIVHRAAASRDALAHTVGEVMTKEVVIGVPEDDVMSVAHTMTERRFRHIPILDGNRLIGIVSIGDLLKAQRDQYRGQIDTLETQIMAKDE
jgi:CBS domain-containing protein